MCFPKLEGLDQGFYGPKATFYLDCPLIVLSVMFLSPCRSRSGIYDNEPSAHVIGPCQEMLVGSDTQGSMQEYVCMYSIPNASRMPS